MTQIRNIAIIAHVDHGKTTLTDALLRQTGAVKDTAVSMDNNALEQERGITIYAKNASLEYKGTRINIVDTPGHADFGSEVERVLRSIDSVLLVVDAQEGPMPQTRFVLKKSLELGLRPIVVVNKIDKQAADPTRTINDIFDLFVELGAHDEQLDFPIVYAVGRDGVAMRHLDDERKNVFPLLDVILEHVPAALSDDTISFRAQAFNLAYDNFLGRLAIVRVYEGSVSVGNTVFLKKNSGEARRYTISRLFTFSGVTRVESSTIQSGEIAMIAGLEDVYIGDTIATLESADILPTIAIDEPTIELTFLVNNSPFAGREGKFVTSRQIRSRLEKELEVNVGLKVNFDTESPDQFTVYGRGELHIAILIENMRREGYELQVSQPRVILKQIDGATSEPFEEIVVDVSDVFQGVVIEKLAKRGAIMKHMEVHHSRVSLIFEGPSRGLFGYRSVFMIDTRGEGILASRVLGYRPYAGEIARYEVGSMVSQETGKSSAFSLANLQVRGTLYIRENTAVYDGMVVGNTSKGVEMMVNPIKGKQLTNMRASRADEAIKLTPPQELTIESGLEIMGDDEYLEVTPESVRLRKIFLKQVDRERASKKKSL